MDPGELPRLTRAYLMAALAHAAQRRKGADDVPYINHLVEVAELVASTGAPAEVVLAAILHDVIEDSDLDAAELREHFGDVTADLVTALTDAPDWAALPRRERKRRQAAHLAEAPPQARLIKLADQISNLNDIVRDPAAWEAVDAEDYVDGVVLVGEACRGTHGGLEDALAAAAAKARAAVAGATS